MAFAIFGIGLGQAGAAGHAGAGGQPGGFASAKPSTAALEYIVVTIMYSMAIQNSRRYFIYTLFESLILPDEKGSVYIPIEETI